jgi:hypothetical protein
VKKLLLVFFVFTQAIAAKSQSYNYNLFGFGGNISAVYPYTDLAIGKNTNAFNITAYYNLTPYVPIGLEYQMGTLSGGDVEADVHGRAYTNKYKAVILHADLYMGQLIEYNFSTFQHIIKDIYIGTGVGLINNNLTDIVRVQPGTGYIFPGKDKSTGIMVPMRVGYEFRINNNFGEQFMGINIGYITNVTWGEGLDGYSDPPKDFKNNAPDLYRQIIVGVKFNFGPMRSFYKQID